MPNGMSVVFLDNIDSFTYNLVDEFAKRGARVEVFRNHLPADLVVARAKSADLLVISPGPGTPERAGSCLEIAHLALGRVPLFGVCLGHQAIVAASGGTVDRAPTPIHGKAVAILHQGAAPFGGLPSPMAGARYHSLSATRVPPSLEVTAESNQVVMAVSHRTAPALGVQFHPESVLTPLGGQLIENVLEWARDAGR